ncbi:MAG: S-formylglutathione hydrolase [Rickettsiales bacterium]|nr:S-formylglutathione hydrolase [Rickettsiales bacterium]
MEIVKQHHCHGGVVYYVEHEAESTGCTMQATVFVPPNADDADCPTLFYLAGLTCTPENFTTKANAYAVAAKLGLVLVAPDTSPRGENVADNDAYDLGQGASFYLNATQDPWAQHYQMESYIVDELYDLVIGQFPVDAQRVGIFGHSMGGHGALTLYLKYPDKFKSASAFAPICAPTMCAWGDKAFSAYLGEDKEAWAQHDASVLMERSQNEWGGGFRPPILIDQGMDDQFLEDQLHPDLFEAACAAVSHPLSLRRHEAYDHSYFFIQTFMADHLQHHADILTGE